MKTIIISGADTGYWSLLSGMLHSIEHDVRRESISVGVLDLGLAPEHLSLLRTFGATVVTPEWDFPITHFRVPPANYLKAMTARPFLTRYFPGYDTYVWLDADCWVQDWKAIALLISTAREKEFSIVAEVHRSYVPFFRNVAYLQWLYGSFRLCYGENVANTLSHFPLLNSGVFASVRDAPHWSHWQSHLAGILKQTNEFYHFSEQVALNGAIRQGTLTTAILPAYCNWMCNRAMPILALDGKTFTEPEPPYVTLGVVHLAAISKTEQYSILDHAGKTHRRVLTYPPLPI